MVRALTKQPSEAESALAKQSARLLASRLSNGPQLQLHFSGSPTGETLCVPMDAIRMLVRILEEMADGNAVAVVPARAELTTQEAADFMNISRPSLVELLEQGSIAFRKVGSHRRVRMDSLLTFKRKADADRKRALAELVAYDQELGL